MPISSSAAIERKKQQVIRSTSREKNKRVDPNEGNQTQSSSDNFLKIGPAIPTPNEQQLNIKRSKSILKKEQSQQSILYDSVCFQSDENGSVIVTRTEKQKEKDPDRISMDRRGLNSFPIIRGENRLRLLSLQHNLINNLEHLKSQSFPFLVFLDFYDNHLERIYGLESAENLRVLLVGKNRLKKLDGFQNLKHVEVLDLHGNKITHINGLSNLSQLKVLNLAGNQIRILGVLDLNGLTSLQELNLKRNRLKKLLGFADTPNLVKLFLSNNELRSIEDMSSIAKSPKIKELCIENNPISLGGDCVSFLVSYLPQLIKLNSIQITEQVRKAAMAWRRNKESTNAAFMDLTSDVCFNVEREEVISNARTNWELVRSQTRHFNTKFSSSSSNIPKMLKNFQAESDFILTPLTKSETMRNQTRRKSLKVPILPDKNKIHNIMRSSSQDTENSQNTTSSSNTSNSEYFRLPPILVPIISKLEQENDSASMKKYGSLSSLVENKSSISFDSDTSSSSSSIESEEDDEKIIAEAPKMNGEKLPIATINEGKNSKSNTDSSSNISSTLSNVTLPSTEEIQFRKSGRNIKSARPKSTQTFKLRTRASTAAKLKKTQQQSTPPIVNKDREQGGDYLIEICGRYLNIYGQGALKFVDKSWNSSKAGDITTARFNYLNFNGIVPVLHKLKIRFPKVENLIFKETNIHCLGQINGLAETQGLTSLCIEEEGNPIYAKKWRSYAVFRLSHWGLKFINDVEISEQEISDANSEYQSLTELVFWMLPDLHLQPLLSRLRIDLKQPEHNAKTWLLNSDCELRSVVSKEALQWKKSSCPQEDTAIKQRAKTQILSILEETTHTVHKLRLLDQQWPSILQEIVCNTLLDYSHIDIYMKQKLQELMNNSF